MILSKLKNFVGRHRKKFIFGSVIILGGIAFSYGRKKLMEYQEKVGLTKNFYSNFLLNFVLILHTLIFVNAASKRVLRQNKKIAAF